MSSKKCRVTDLSMDSLIAVGACLESQHAFLKVLGSEFNKPLSEFEQDDIVALLKTPLRRFHLDAECYLDFTRQTGVTEIVGVDFSGCDLSGWESSTKVEFVDCDFTECNFYRADLTMTQFTNCKFSDLNALINSGILTDYCLLMCS